MIAYVHGVIEDISEDNVVVDVGGIGYNVRISADTVSNLPAVGDTVRLYTYTLVREDAFLLYGFLSRDALDIFKKCITVNGIGPKGAMAILSAMDVDSLRYAIMTGDAKAISKAPGIGIRTAERLILDLKDKIKIDDAMISREITENTSALQSNDGQQRMEAIEALVSLGYGRTDSIKAVNSIPTVEGLDSGEILKAALKMLF